MLYVPSGTISIRAKLRLQYDIFASVGFGPKRNCNDDGHDDDDKEDDKSNSNNKKFVKKKTHTHKPSLYQSERTEQAKGKRSGL